MADNAILYSITWCCPGCLIAAPCATHPSLWARLIPCTSLAINTDTVRCTANTSYTHVPGFPLPFRFVVFLLPLSFVFLVSPFSLFFFSLPCSPWWRILFFCLRATPPPRCLRASLQVCVFPLCAVLLLVFFLVCIYIFSSLPSLFDFDMDVNCFIQPFFRGFHAVSSVSVSVATQFVYGTWYIIKENKTPAVRSRILSKLIFASCVGYFGRPYYGFMWPHQEC